MDKSLNLTSLKRSNLVFCFCVKFVCCVVSLLCFGLQLSLPGNFGSEQHTSGVDWPTHYPSLCDFTSDTLTASDLPSQQLPSVQSRIITRVAMRCVRSQNLVSLQLKPFTFWPASPHLPKSPGPGNHHYNSLLL